MFHSRLGDELPDVIVERDGEAFVVDIEIARSANTLQLVYVRVMLEPGSFRDEVFHELSYSIGVLWIDNSGPSFLTQDRFEAARFIPDGARPHLVPIVCRAARAIIESVRPKLIYRVMKVCDPPARAMRKHDALTFAIEQIGYSVRNSGKDPVGRTYWYHQQAV